MNKPSFQDLARHLTGDRTPRVWSLLVTVFGELAQKEGSRISGALLGRLTSLMGIKPEAMRVALHRLRKDGWIGSERTGRTSAYFLTDWGRAQSAEATPKIYNLHAVREQAWLVVFDPAQPVGHQDASGTWIAPNLLITTTCPAREHAFVTPILPGTPLPDWMTHKICTPETIQLAHDFHDRLNQFQQALEAAAELDRFEISAMRVLIVDGWRRIILRAPDVPDHIFPDTWLGQPCRENVASLLARFPKPDLNDLEITVTA